MFLFSISFLLVFLSSYFLMSVLSTKKNVLGIIYIFLIAFAQLILTFEILSLFTAIKQFWVLTFNVLFLISSIYIWNQQRRPLWSLDCSIFRNRIINSLKFDKSLMFLYVGFLVLIISSLVLCFVFPITSADAEAYHVSRSLFWVLQGSLNHFEVADIRCLCLPINSEILYSWILLFVKKDIFFGFFSFVGYLLSIISIYNIMGFLGYCTRKRLWVIFIVSSFSSVLVQLSSTETDIIIAGLALSCVYLFWNALRNNDKISIYMSSLAYAIALGTKTTSIIMLPGVGILLLTLCFYYKKFKPLAQFLGLGLLNFLIFSSYNYILNFLDFSNFMGTTSFMIVSKNYYGIKGMAANFIKYIFMFFDFTGFRWSDYLGPTIINLRTSILNYLHLGYINDGLYTTPYMVNRLLLEPVMGAGILGFLVFLPCVIGALIKPVFKFKSKKTWFIFLFGTVFIINLLSISYFLAYMSFSTRFVMSFMVLSAPILVYSYLSRKNPIKYIIVAFSLFYMICVSTHLWARPLSVLGKILHEHPSISYVRELAHCYNYEKIPQPTNSTCLLVKKIREIKPDENRILAFINTSDNIYLIKALEFEGYKIDFGTLEDINKFNINNYNLIISSNKGQSATVIKDYAKRKNDCKLTKNKVIFIKKNKVPCIYIPNSKIQNANSPEKLYPYQVKCIFSKEYLLENNLRIIGIAGIATPIMDEYDYYILYRNISLPLKYKSKHLKN